jgi:L-ribulose-5-phosphate 4-epimerase
MSDVAATIIAACLQLESDGLVVGTYGNVSARVDGGLMITPSRVAYADLRPDDLVTVTLSGEVVTGVRVPSSETAVHRRIYQRRPDVRAIVHAHPLHASALSCLHRPLDVIVEEQAQVLGGTISCTTYVLVGQHEALGDAVATALGDAQAVLLANHGLVTVGSDMDAALFATSIAERVAHMHLLVLASGRAPVPIPARHAASERDRYVNRYGTAADHPRDGTS